MRQKALSSVCFVGLFCLMASLSGCKEHDAVPPTGETSGEMIFMSHCAGCHAEGGNAMNPSKPLKGSAKLADFETFHSFIQAPGPAMPAFGAAVLPDAEAKKLFEYVSTSFK